MSASDKRPPTRTERLGIALDAETLASAAHNAGGRPRLVAMLRVWLRRYAAEETGPLAEDAEINKELRRAQKTPAKKRRSGG